MSRTLAEVRAEIESLATRDGEFRVVCSRTGCSPVPVDGLAFPDRESAVRAARLTAAYRRRLRRWDRRAPTCEPVVYRGCRPADVTLVAGGSSRVRTE